MEEILCLCLGLPSQAVALHCFQTSEDTIDIHLQNIVPFACREMYKITFFQAILHTKDIRNIEI